MDKERTITDRLWELSDGLRMTGRMVQENMMDFTSPTFKEYVSITKENLKHFLEIVETLK